MSRVCCLLLWISGVVTVNFKLNCSSFKSLYFNTTCLTNCITVWQCRAAASHWRLTVVSRFSIGGGSSECSHSALSDYTHSAMARRAERAAEWAWDLFVRNLKCVRLGLWEGAGFFICQWIREIGFVCLTIGGKYTRGKIPQANSKMTAFKFR